MVKKKHGFLNEDYLVHPQRIRSDQLYSGSTVSWTEEESRAEIKRRKNLGKRQL